MKYECCAGGTARSDQRSLFPAAGGLGGALSPPAVPGQTLMGVQGAKPPEALEIIQLAFAKNTPSWSICPELQFHEFC